MYLVSSVRAERLAVHRRVSDILARHTLGTSKFDIQRLGSHRVETSPAEACNSCRYGGALGDDGVQHGPTTPYSSHVLCQRCVTGLEFAQRALALQPIDSFSVLSIAQCRMSL